MMSNQLPHYDLIIIGGGISGIISARLYLDIHPTSNVAVIERDGTVGGTWSRERSYPGFKAQASTRMVGFSDIDISVPPGGTDEYDCPHSIHVSEYLEVYLEKHIYDGKPLKDRFHLNSLITNAKKEQDNLWHVKFTQAGEAKEFTAEKLLVATGITSQPNIPVFSGQDDFKGPIVHSINFGRSWSSIQKSEDIQKVTVLGAGKSASDFVYQLVKAGMYSSHNYLIFSYTVQVKPLLGCSERMAKAQVYSSRLKDPQDLRISLTLQIRDCSHSSSSQD
jgi:dimethylaniline monooxygenase (N-oxide forming)